MDQDKPIITVSVLTYNSSRFILETLDSIKNQTYPNIILHVCDDCSTDNTVELCKKWIDLNKQRFVSVKVIVPEQNTGVSANSNRVWDACETKWNKVIAGDDLLMPNCIQDNVNYIQDHPESIFVFSKIGVFGSNESQNQMIGDQFDYAMFEKSLEEQLQRILDGNNFIPASTAFENVHKIKELGIRHDERVRDMEDMPKWVNVLRKGIKFQFMDKETVRYRVHEASLSTSSLHSVRFERSMQQYWFHYVFAELYKVDPDKAIDRAVRKNIGLYEFMYNIMCNRYYKFYQSVKGFFRKK